MKIAYLYDFYVKINVLHTKLQILNFRGNAHIVTS